MTARVEPVAGGPAAQGGAGLLQVHEEGERHQGHAHPDEPRPHAQPVRQDEGQDQGGGQQGQPDVARPVEQPAHQPLHRRASRARRVRNRATPMKLR